MCSKVSDAKLHSPAAYLLFYRRRSDKPLGPQYLQDLVTEFRNPPEAESPADDADEAESGEGKLGGPTSLLHGSSSALIVAGADMNASHRNIGSGDGAGAGSSPTTKGTTMKDQPSGENEDGTQHSPHESGYGNLGNNEWGFSALLQHHQADAGDTETLLGKVARDHESDESMRAEGNGDSAMGSDFDEDDHHDFFEEDLSTAVESPPFLVTTPDMRDDHELYSNTYRSHGTDEMDTLHLEDTGGMGGDGMHSPDAVDIRLGGGNSTDVRNDADEFDEMV